MVSKPRLTLVRKAACLFPVLAVQASRGHSVTGKHLQMARCPGTFDRSVMSSLHPARDLESGSCCLVPENNPSAFHRSI